LNQLLTGQSIAKIAGQNEEIKDPEDSAVNPNPKNPLQFCGGFLFLFI